MCGPMRGELNSPDAGAPNAQEQAGAKTP
jgi:hypothetical protein